MKYFAQINNNNLVVQVIVTEETLDWVISTYGGLWIETFIDANQRYNYAGIGYTYDAISDAFIGPMPECGHNEVFLNDLKRWICTNEVHNGNKL
jgi:hypothetical protein